MYNTNVDADSRPSLGAGINQNLELSSVSMENSKSDGSGKPVLTLVFSNDVGATFKKMFWEIDPERIIKQNQATSRTHNRNNDKKGWVKGEPITNDQAVEIAFDEFGRHIKHIMTKFMSEQEATITGATSYEDFCKKVVAKFDGKTAGKKMRMKLVYNYRDYLDIPRFGNFIETMEQSPSTLEINHSRDKMKKSIPSSSEQISAAVTSLEPNSDLPF